MRAIAIVSLGRSGVISVPEDGEKKLRGKSVNHGLKRSVAWSFKATKMGKYGHRYEKKAGSIF